jgi:hypothetical protein
MHRLRRSAIVITGLFVSVAALLVAAPEAFAERLDDPSGASGPAASTTLVTHTGMASWEIIVIAVGVAVVAVTLTWVAFRARTRMSLRPAGS